MYDGATIVATSLKIEHFNGWKLKSPLGILENKFTKVIKYDSETFQKKINAQFAWIYYKPTKECWEDWVALEDCMNCIKVLCRVDHEDGKEEIYLDFNKNVLKTSLSPQWLVVYVAHNFYKPPYKHLKGCINIFNTSNNKQNKKPQKRFIIMCKSCENKKCVLQIVQGLTNCCIKIKALWFWTSPSCHIFLHQKVFIKKIIYILCETSKLETLQLHFCILWNGIWNPHEWRL